MDEGDIGGITCDCGGDGFDCGDDDDGGQGELEVENLNWTETCRLSQVGNSGQGVKNHRLIESWQRSKNRPSMIKMPFPCLLWSLQAVQNCLLIAEIL